MAAKLSVTRTSRPTPPLAPASDADTGVAEASRGSAEAAVTGDADPAGDAPPELGDGAGTKLWRAEGDGGDGGVLRRLALGEGAGSADGARVRCDDGVGEGDGCGSAVGRSGLGEGLGEADSVGPGDGEDCAAAGSAGRASASSRTELTASTRPTADLPTALTPTALTPTAPSGR